MTKGLPELAVMEIPIHVDATECPFDRINFAVLIAIQLLKMVVGQIRGLRIGHTGSMRIWARIVTLRIFEYAVVHEIRSRLHDGFGRNLFPNLDLQSIFRWR